MSAKHDKDSVREIGLELWEGVLVAFVLFLWTSVFLAGTLIPSAPFRAQIRTFQFADVETFLEVTGLTLVSYTLSNLLGLCVLASLLGAFGSRAKLDPHPDDGSDHHLDTSSPYISAAIRGFFIYLAVLAGVLILTENPFLDPQQATYIRTAGFVSLFGFLASYNPGIFGGLLSRVGDFLQGNGRAKPDADPPPAAHASGPEPGWASGSGRRSTDFER